MFDLPGQPARPQRLKEEPGHIPGVHAGQPNEPVLTRWLAHLVLDIGTGPDGGGITFGSLADGIVVAQRHPRMWTVSFRPNPDGTGMRYCTDLAVVARIVIAREHDETAAVKPPRPARAFVLAVRIPVAGFVPAVDPDMSGSPGRRGGSGDVSGDNADGMTVQVASCP